MSKKIISIFMALVLALSMSVVAASAAETEEEATGAEVQVETSGDSGKIYFEDPWNSSQIYFYIWDSTSGLFAGSNGWTDVNPWGLRATRGTKVEGEENLWESYEFDIPDGHNVFVIFHDTTIGVQTYDCVLTSNAFGDTAYVTGNTFENPADSSKSAIEAVFKNASDCGPYRQITSIGNIVGSYSAPADDPAQQVANFVLNHLEYATTDNVANAISVFGTDADSVWNAYLTHSDDASYNEEEAKKVINPSSGNDDTDSDSDSDSDTDKSSDSDSDNTSSKNNSSSNNNSNNSSKAGTTTGGTTTASGSTTGSTDTAATGDARGTVAFAVVLFAAAAAIVVARKKVQD